jgi:hypothetical protein
MRKFTLNLWPAGGKYNSNEDKESAVIDGVDGNGKKTFGIKHYLHQFYLSPTVEEVEGAGAWYLLPPPPSQRTGLYVCRILTVLGLLLLLSGAAAIIVGYMWPHDTNIEASLMRIAISQDDEGNFYIPPERFSEILRDPMHKWKITGFCVFAVGASIMALSLLVPTCANLVGGHRLAAFASGDSTPNEPPIRIYPSAGTKFKVVPTKLAGGHKISPTSGPVPAMEEISKVQPGGMKLSPSSTADDLLFGSSSDATPLIR